MKCFSCGHEDALLLLTSTLCVNDKCDNFDQKHAEAKVGDVEKKPKKDVSKQIIHKSKDKSLDQLLDQILGKSLTQCPLFIDNKQMWDLLWRPPQYPYQHQGWSPHYPYHPQWYPPLAPQWHLPAYYFTWNDSSTSTTLIATNPTITLTGNTSTNTSPSPIFTNVRFDIA